MITWALFIVFGVFISNLAVGIPLVLWSRTRSRRDKQSAELYIRSNEELIRDIQETMRHFHERLS